MPVLPALPNRNYAYRFIEDPLSDREDAILAILTQTSYDERLIKHIKNVSVNPNFDEFVLTQLFSQDYVALVKDLERTRNWVEKSKTHQLVKFELFYITALHKVDGKTEPAIIDFNLGGKHEDTIRAIVFIYNESQRILGYR